MIMVSLAILSLFLAGFFAGLEIVIVPSSAITAKRAEILAGVASNYAHMCKYIHSHACTYTHTRTNTHMNIYNHIHTRIYTTYTHTHTHAHKHNRH
jgi:hypothetical protein